MHLELKSPTLQYWTMIACRELFTSLDSHEHHDDT